MKYLPKFTCSVLIILTYLLCLSACSEDSIGSSVMKMTIQPDILKQCKEHKATKQCKNDVKKQWDACFEKFGGYGFWKKYNNDMEELASKNKVCFTDKKMKQSAKCKPVIEKATQLTKSSFVWYGNFESCFVDAEGKKYFKSNIAEMFSK